jgi:hypothetical protein
MQSYAQQNVTRSDIVARGPTPNNVYIESISYGGTGCPQGTVGTSVSDDRTVFTLIYDMFIASSGSGVPVVENKKSCELNLNFHIPQGFSLSIVNLTNRGYAQLAAGQTGEVKSLVSIGNSTKELSFDTDFVGPVVKDYTITDRLSMYGLVWSACGTSVPLHMDNSITIGGNTSVQGQLTLDSTDGKVSQEYGLIWKRCRD